MTRALVLSGGGSVGIAWQSGLTVGLAEQDLQLAEADLVVGTSAGSAVGAQIALGRDLREQVARYRDADARRAGASGTDAPPGVAAPAEGMQRLMELMASAMTQDADPEATRVLIGKFALEAETIPEERFVANFRYLDGEAWPRRFACTAVDAESGAFIVWDGGNRAELPRAVASSCAVPGLFPPVTIDGRRYIDGGMRSGTNADLAEGHDRVLIVSLMSTSRLGADSDPRMERYRLRMDDELALLAESGASVEILTPDEEAATVLGANLMDATRTLAAAEAGIRQGRQVAERLADFWADA
jgi:NTE family protein